MENRTCQSNYHKSTNQNQVYMNWIVFHNIVFRLNVELVVRNRIRRMNLNKTRVLSCYNKAQRDSGNDFQEFSWMFMFAFPQFRRNSTCTLFGWIILNQSELFSRNDLEYEKRFDYRANNWCQRDIVKSIILSKKDSKKHFKFSLGEIQLHISSTSFPVECFDS